MPPKLKLRIKKKKELEDDDIIQPILRDDPSIEHIGYDLAIQTTKVLNYFMTKEDFELFTDRKLTDEEWEKYVEDKQEDFHKFIMHTLEIDGFFVEQEDGELYEEEEESEVEDLDCRYCDETVNEDNFYRDEFNNKRWDVCHDCGMENEEELNRCGGAELTDTDEEEDLELSEDDLDGEGDAGETPYNPLENEETKKWIDKVKAIEKENGKFPYYKIINPTDYSQVEYFDDLSNAVLWLYGVAGTEAQGWAVNMDIDVQDIMLCNLIKEDIATIEDIDI